MKNEHVQISLKLYNELRDFKESILHDKTCVMNAYGFGLASTYISKDEGWKMLKEEIDNLRLELCEVNSELNDKQIEIESKVERMSIWGLIKWRNKLWNKNN